MASELIHNPVYLEKIKRFCLMDDTFMSKVFEDKKCAELLLKIILKKDLTVTEVISQCSVKNLQGRSARLDIYALDESGIHYNIEVQRSDGGAVPKRARYNSSLMDANISGIGEDYEALPETYVIFITENDVLKGDQPLYTIHRKIEELDNQLFEDKSHIIYVNGAIRDETALGKLMQDFFCKETEKMNYEVLAERAGYFKNDTKGVNSMCEIMEELKRDSILEGIRESQIEIAQNMLAEGTFAFELIARITNLTLEEVQALSEGRQI